MRFLSWRSCLSRLWEYNMSLQVDVHLFFILRNHHSSFAFRCILASWESSRHFPADSNTGSFGYFRDILIMGPSRSGARKSQTTTKVRFVRGWPAARSLQLYLQHWFKRVTDSSSSWRGSCHDNAVESTLKLYRGGVKRHHMIRCLVTIRQQHNPPP